MKSKFYLRIFLAAITALFVATGCKDDDKTDTPDPIPVTFELQVNSIDSGGAVVAVKPSDKSATYFYGAMPKTQFEAFASQATFLAAETARIESLAQQHEMTTEAYLKANGKRGDQSVTVSTVEPQTAHYAYVYAVASDGKITSAVFKAEFTSAEAPVTAPELAMTLTPGDSRGLDKDIRLTINAKSARVAYGQVLFLEKEELDAIIASGETLETILINHKFSSPLEDSEIQALNTVDGWSYSFRNLTPGTAYTTILGVADANGLMTIRTISESTLTDAGTNGPTLALSLTRGDRDGNDKISKMTATIKTTGTVAGKFVLFAKSALDEALEQGLSLTYIMANNGTDFSEEQITQLNSAEGLQVNIVELEPGRSYTFIAKVASPGGTTIQTASASTTTGVGPTMTATIVPGDAEGEHTDVNMLASLKSSGVLSGRYRLMLTSEWNQDTSLTPAQALDASSTAFTSDDLSAINSAQGQKLVFSSLTPSTAYSLIVETNDDNGTSYDIREALTSASGPSSQMTFSFDIQDLAPKSVDFAVIPSNNTESYYFDYIETAEFDKRTDAEWIARAIGTDGISAESLSTGIAGYDASWFSWLELTPGTSYCIYAFGYSAQDKSATTALFKQTFTTPTGNEPATEAYKAWLGSWTVTSTSAEKTDVAVSFDVTIAQKVPNISYTIKGWSATTTQQSRLATAAFTAETGGFRVRNNQPIAEIADGVITLAGRFYNSNTLKYARVPGRIDILTATLNAGNQSASVAGCQFQLEDDPNTYTVSTMDFFNHKYTDAWTGYVANGAFTASGHPVGPYTMTKKSGSSAPQHIAAAPAAKTAPSEKQRIALAKKARQASPAQTPSMSSVLRGKKAVAGPSIGKLRVTTSINTPDANHRPTRPAAQKIGPKR